MQFANVRFWWELRQTDLLEGIRGWREGNRLGCELRAFVLRNDRHFAGIALNINGLDGNGSRK
jgi:hypothetical protein